MRTTSRNFGARQIARRDRRALPARTTRPRSIRAQATSATICWASTSSGCMSDVQRIEFAAAHAVEQRGAFDQVVARQREQPRPSACRRPQWPERPTRCRNVEIERGEAIWQTRSTSPMSMPSSSDAVATSARSSPRLRRCSAARRCSARQAAVMRRDRVLAEALAQVPRHALGHAPRVDEHQGGAVLARSAAARRA